MEREALKQLDWRVVRDLYEVESAAFWYRGPEPHPNQVDPTTIKTEMFLLPAAASTEKEGSFTNTQRLLQWREKAVDPSRDAPSALLVVFHLRSRLKEIDGGSREPRGRALPAFTRGLCDEEP